MFWYQCRYCKDSFDQWEKLVTHRRDEHSREFEALKRKSAVLLKKQEEAVKSRGRKLFEHRVQRHVKPLEASSVFFRMKPSISGNSSSGSELETQPRRNMLVTSKEVDAKDLENQEISLCVPTSSCPSPPEPSPFKIPATPPPSYATPPSSPRGLPNKRMKLNLNANYHDSLVVVSATSFSCLTPPRTPNRVSPTSSPHLSEEQLNNWSPPVDLKKAVQLHQMSADAEIEICTVPSAGSCISVTKHLPSEKNGAPKSSHAVGSTKNVKDILKRSTNGVGQQQQMGSHVVVENLDDELTMTCSNYETEKTNHAVQGSSRGNGQKPQEEASRYMGSRPKRIKLRLEEQESEVNFARQSKPAILENVRRHREVLAAAKVRAAAAADSTANDSTVERSGTEKGKEVITSANTCTDTPRLNTRASVRRPNKKD